jgi:hypothetical protein
MIFHIGMRLSDITKTCCMKVDYTFLVWCVLGRTWTDRYGSEFTQDSGTSGWENNSPTALGAVTTSSLLPTAERSWKVWIQRRCYSERSQLTQWVIWVQQYRVGHWHSARLVEIICSVIYDSLEPRFYVPVVYVFPSFATFYFTFLQFPHIHKLLFTSIYISEISNFPWLTSLECLQREQLWCKMASAERLLVSTCFVTYYYCHPLGIPVTKMNMYIGLQNKNGVSSLTITENKRQLTMLCGWWNHKWHPLQAGILRNCDE